MRIKYFNICAIMSACLSFCQPCRSMRKSSHTRCAKIA